LIPGLAVVFLKEFINYILHYYPKKRNSIMQIAILTFIHLILTTNSIVVAAVALFFVICHDVSHICHVICHTEVTLQMMRWQLIVCRVVT
jgi:hypothetical protein